MRIWKLSILFWCQPGSRLLRPVRIGRAVGSHVDGGWRALEDVEVPGSSLPGGERIALAVAPVPMMPTRLSPQTRQIALRVAARVRVVPAAGVEDCGLEGLDSGDPGQLGLLEKAIRQADESAFIASPRFVEMIQRALSSSQRISVTSVWKQASR